MSALREKLDELMDQNDNLKRRNKSLILENDKQKEIASKLADEVVNLLNELKLKECQE